MERRKRVVVHDWLRSKGGAEKVLEEIVSISEPEAIYTLLNFLQNPFADTPVHTTFVQNIPLASKLFPYLLPLFQPAITSLDLSRYQTIISSSWAFAKGVKKHLGQLHICYCHTPMRYIWDLEEEYLSQVPLLLRPLARQFFDFLRRWDKKNAQEVDVFIANSHYVADRIWRIYNRRATVIYPPIDTKAFFGYYGKREDYYIIASRLVPYKRIDLLIEACQKLKKRLLIIGEGEEKQKLMHKADPRYIQFLGYQPFEKTAHLLQRARGFLYAALEDFGMAVVEAQACGTPVIALGKGGTAESVVNEVTGILYEEQSIDALTSAIECFEKHEFDPQAIVHHAKTFDRSIFTQRFSDLLHRAENEL